VRTRYGLSLSALGITLVWLGGRGLDPVVVALQAAALSAILGAAALAGSRHEREALNITLTHPTTPLALATARWCVIVLPAALLACACCIAVGGDATGMLAGLATAAAVGGCALALVLPLGRSAAVVLFLLMAVAGSVPPERLVDLARPGLVRLAAASTLELGPSLWHYREIGAGDVGAVAHALAWAGLGVLLASAVIGRPR
jgi:hypothetical protein